MVLFDLLICFVGNYIMYEFIGVFLEKNTGSNKLFFLIFSSGALWGINLLGNALLNVVGSVIIMIAVSSFAFVATMSANVMLPAFAVALNVFSEFIASYFLVLILGEDINAVLQNDFGVAIASVFAKMFSFIIYRLIHLSYSKQQAEHYKFRFSLSLLSPLVGVFIMFSLLHFDVFIPNSFTYSLWQVIIFLSILATNVLVLKIYDEQQNIHIAKMSLKSAVEFQKQQEDIIELHRIHMSKLLSTTHDFNNHIITLNTLLNNDVTEATNYIQSLIEKDNEQPQTLKQFTVNPVLNGLLSLKQMECEKFSISLITDISYSDVSIFSSSELISLFGNALDNAIRACANIQNGDERLIKLSMHQYNELLSIEISNTRYNEDRIIFKAGKYSSTKKNSELHGFGIEIMKSIVEDKKGAITITPTDRMFRITILLPIEKK